MFIKWDIVDNNNFYSTKTGLLKHNFVLLFEDVCPIELVLSVPNIILNTVD